METIPTIEELFNKYSNLYQFEEGSPEYLIDKDDFKEAIIIFIKSHVTQALKEASENVDLLCGNSRKKNGKHQESCGKWCDGCDNVIVDKDSILNAYDLNNIK